MTSSPPASSPDAAAAATATAVRRPGRPRDVRVDQAVLEATLVELAANGYAGLSMDKVAARAGVGKATIYRRWASREAMILDAWRCVDPHKDHDIDTGTLRGDLSRMLDEYRTGFGTGTFAALLPQIVAGVYQSPSLKQLFESFVDEQMEPLVELYARAARRGELRDDVDPVLAADLLAAVIFSRLLLRGEVLPPEQLEASIDVVLSGVLRAP